MNGEKMKSWRKKAIATSFEQLEDRNLLAGDADSAMQDLSLELHVRDSYLPGTPLLVRAQLVETDSTIHRDRWDAVVKSGFLKNQTPRTSPDEVRKNTKG